MRLRSLSKLSSVEAWKQVPWRLKAMADKSGLNESRAADEIRWIRRAGREDSVFSRDGKRPARLLLVMMESDYGSPRRGLSYEHFHLFGTLAEWGFEIVHFDFMRLMQAYGRDAMNEMLQECVVQCVPDVAVFVMFSDELYPDAVEAVRDRGVLTLNWFCDDQWRYEGFSSNWAPRFDYVVTTSEKAIEKYRRDGHQNVLKSQFGFNPYRFSPYKSHEDALYDVTFIGQPHGDRKQMVSALREAGLDVTTFGYGWPEGKLLYGQMLDVFNKSKIVLGLSNDWRGETAQVKGRDFEVPALGSLYVTALNHELESYFTGGEELLFYTDTEHLIEICRDMLKSDSEREQIALRGQQRAWADHTYVHRFSDVFAGAGLTRIRAGAW
jgi:spore maturation protein CgeB